MTPRPCMPCGPGQDALLVAAAAPALLADLGDRHRLGQRVDADVSLAPAGFACRRDRADAVQAHVRERHWRPGGCPHGPVQVPVRFASAISFITRSMSLAASSKLMRAK